MKKRGQVWVETVIYTLIALTMIGLVLSFARPKIMELQDKAILEQSFSMMKHLNNIVLDISQAGSGNRKEMEIGIRKGSLIIDSSTDTLRFEMEDSLYTYSEPDEEVEQGGIKILTTEIGDLNSIAMFVNYSYNISFDNSEQQRTLRSAPVPYTVYIENQGLTEDKININFELS